MQLIIMDSRLTRCRTLQLTGGRLVAAALAASLVLMCVAALLYHLVFLKGAREGWPVVGSLVRLVVQDEFDQRDRTGRDGGPHGGGYQGCNGFEPRHGIAAELGQSGQRR